MLAIYSSYSTPQYLPKTYVHIKVCTQMFIGTLFVIQLINLIAGIVSRVYTDFKTYQIVYFKHVQLLVSQLYLNKVFQKLSAK